MLSLSGFFSTGGFKAKWLSSINRYIDQKRQTDDHKRVQVNLRCKLKVLTLERVFFVFLTCQWRKSFFVFVFSNVIAYAHVMQGWMNVFFFLVVLRSVFDLCI